MNAILRKSAAGLEALQSRETGTRLSARLRTLLLQVDGQKRAEQLTELAVSLGNPPDTIAKLLELGLIEIVPGSEIVEEVAEPEPAQVQRSLAGAALAEVASPPMASPEPAPPATPTGADCHEDLPVSAKLPEALRPVAALMRKLADKHLGLSALLLKRRISKSESEAELRLALVALRDALVKASNSEQADALLHEVYEHLPMIGLNRAQTF
ncbi:hypothetical protein [Chitinimonas taiwanensis]|uniref:Uncharacterized protein n=1 Tax=Chitinimonas taiwanensis DSM 18899 TaxID=1121279 RepID=A0A1K2HED1_9NEIS|nr:hypothetical protein [Chitinimonas taiwanensis]SFZ75192.1 hypothetical protein SAMN02745887_01500 [Chitinimonas taiwanensis DSM 18899]